MSNNSNNTICGNSLSIRSKRGLLASIWSIVSIVTAISFLTAFIFAITSKSNNQDENYNYNGYYNYEGQGGNQENMEGQEGRNGDPEVAVTSRALAFSALWTGVMAALLSVFGTVILGWQSPTGQYYTCCGSSVHRTTPLGLGSFIGALLMFANLTLICSVLFGEFEIRDNREGAGEERGGGDATYGERESRLSMAFSILCMVLTVIYAGFAALTFAYSNCVIEEHIMDEREEAMMLSTRNKTVVHFNAGYDGYNNPGYIGERFDVGRNGGFVSPSAQDATLA
jgi:hypothetical protein